MTVQSHELRDNELTKVRDLYVLNSPAKIAGLFSCGFRVIKHRYSDLERRYWWLFVRVAAVDAG